MLEAVPNVSEGRDASVIESVGAALASSARLLDVHSDEDHHRSVYTLVADEDELVASLLVGIAVARDLIDLRQHEGVHPRVGVVDVAPIAYLDARDASTAAGVARQLAERAGAELGLPVFLYGDVGDGRRPAFFRRGGLPELERRLEAGELEPEFGPSKIDPRVGAVLVGSRKPLVAYNVVLATNDVTVARGVAEAVRESSGGLPGVQAIGLWLPRSGHVQVSMNVLDLDRTPLHAVVAAVTREAAERDVSIAAGELVGLVPQRALDEARAAGVELPGVDESRVLERLMAL